MNATIRGRRRRPMNITGEEGAKLRRRRVERGVAVMILSMALSAVVFLVAGLAGLFLTGIP
jgi:hypothetical protein